MKHKQEKKFYLDVVKQINETNQKLTKAQKNYEVIGEAYTRVEKEYNRFGAMTEDVKRLGFQQKSLVMNYVKLLTKHNALIDGLMKLQEKRPDIFQGLTLEVLKDESITTEPEAPKDKPEPVPPEKPVQQEQVDEVYKVGQQ